MPVIAVTCTSARFPAATYPSRFHGKPMAGRCIIANSIVTHTNGAARHARSGANFPSQAIAAANARVK